MKSEQKQSMKSEQKQNMKSEQKQSMKSEQKQSMKIEQKQNIKSEQKQNMKSEQKQRVLVIGAGGIGIEIAKLLKLNKHSITEHVLKITIIDCDTIELSNLNRQFIFTINDINKFKSSVTKNYLKCLQIEIDSINQKIKFDKNYNPWSSVVFDLKFFSEFDVIFNCLDNLESRKFIMKRVYLTNRILRNEKPILIIDGGTTGFLGQVRSFLDKSCYDCLNIQNNTEVIPVCTIKGKPETFEHCLIWATNEVNTLKENILTDMPIDQKQFSFTISTDNENISNYALLENLSNYGLLENISNYALLENLSNEITGVFSSSNKIDILNFLNNKKSRMKIIYFLSNKRCSEFNITKRLSFTETESKLNQIIPSISTVNSIISSLMLRNFFNFIKNNELRDFFVTGSKILKSKITEKNVECEFCKNKIVILSKPFEKYSENILKKTKEEKKTIEIFSNELSEIKDFLNLKFFLLSNFEDPVFFINVTKTFKESIRLFYNQIYLIQAEDKTYVFLIENSDDFNIRMI
ncbi:Ubiquitin-activating enzyme E1-like [Cucumispora dikerogammari]|nr:Ubiquitin-activating enzyme E1-like [Cucumispora dikerogammari]